MGVAIFPRTRELDSDKLSSLKLLLPLHPYRNKLIHDIEPFHTLRRGDILVQTRQDVYYAWLRTAGVNMECLPKDQLQKKNLYDFFLKTVGLTVRLCMHFSSVHILMFCGKLNVYFAVSISILSCQFSFSCPILTLRYLLVLFSDKLKLRFSFF